MAKKTKRDDFKEWENQYGIDPRQKGNIRSNNQKAPSGIDWDTLIAKGLQKGNPSNKTSLGFVNDQGNSRKKQD